MHDMHAAMLAAAGQPIAAHRGPTRRLNTPVRASVTTHEYFDGELPSVDDLEVAAAAAMADVAPEPLPASTSDESTSDMDSDSDSDEASGGPGSTADDQMSAGDKEGGRPVRAQLIIDGGAVRLRLDLQDAHTGSGIGSMAAGTARMGIVDIRQRPVVGPPVISDSDMSSDSDKELPDVDVLADIRARLDEPVDEDADEKAAFVSSVLDELPPVKLLDVEIAPNDELIPAGRVASVLEGVVIVQVPELGRVFDEGTVLCLEDRMPLGRVTEVFGPIQAPLYALRYSGSSGAPPDSVTAGAHVCAVARYALALEPEIVQQQAPNIEEEIEQDDPSFQFSDDEQEAEYQRGVAKRPATPVGEAVTCGSFERGRQQSMLGGRGREAGGGHGRGGFMKRQGGRGRGGRQGLPRGVHPTTGGQAAAGMSFGGTSPGPPQWPGQLQRQGWSTSLPQQPAFSSPPAAFSSSMQFGGVQQLPNGSFVLPIAQQVVLTPQQMQQLQQTGQFPSQLVPFIAQQGSQPPAPSGAQQFSPQFISQQYPSPLFAGPPIASQAFQQQLSAQQAQQSLAPTSNLQSPPQPPRPPPRPLYRTGL